MIMKKLVVAMIIAAATRQAYAGKWVQVKDWAVPLKVNTVVMEKMLWDYINVISKKAFEPRDSYIYQYKTINDHELFINALCNTKSNDKVLTREFVAVLDGGSCYFQATYDFKKNTFVKLEVNGEL
jgi:hypothetical protein